jgi:hypothetical protein
MSMRTDDLVEQHSVQDRFDAEPASAWSQLFPGAWNDAEERPGYSSVDSGNVLNAHVVNSARIDPPPAPSGVGEAFELHESQRCGKPFPFEPESSACSSTWHRFLL